MIINRRWALALAAAGLSSTTALAVDLSGTLSQSGGLLSPNVSLVVSTVPVTDPVQALNPAVFIASQSVPMTGSIPYGFSGLPFFGAPTSYYVYAFRDYNADGVPASTEPMGGFGPFPFQDSAAQVTATAPTDVFSGVPVSLFARGEITGTVVNQSAQAGARIVVRAIDTSQPPDTWQVLTFPVSGSLTYALGGLKPGLSYTVESWIDTQGLGTTGALNPDPFEDKAVAQGPYTATAGATQTGVGLTISSGSVGGSTPDHIRLAGPQDSWHQVISSGLPSGYLTVSVRDFNDVLTATPTSTLVTFTAHDSAGVPVPFALSLDNFTSTTATVTVPGGAPLSAPFQFLYAGTGFVGLQAQAVNFPTAGESRFAFFSFDVLPAGAGFTAVNARTTSDPAVTTGTAVSISPDRDGVNDGAIVSCTPPDPTAFWELVVSTDTGFSAGVVRRFFGTGPGQVFWYGEGADGRVVPNGTYYLRFQTEGGGLASSVLFATVTTDYVKGSLTDGANPVADAEVQVFGPGGGGATRSAADGSFFIGGLKAGQPYTLQAARPGFDPLSFTVTASSDVGAQVLGLGATLQVKAFVTSPALQDIYGHVFVHDASYSSVVSGPLHLAAGATVTDNGRPAADPDFNVYTLLGVRPGVSYTVEVDLPQFGRSVSTITIASPGGSGSVTPTLTRKANITGSLGFPAALNTPFGGGWVSVDAVPGPGAPPVAWGGGFVSNGNLSGTYQLFGIDPGTYTLRAFSRGYVQTSTGPLTVSASDLTGVDFPTFSQGGVITGTITINGDLSALTSTGFGGGTCGAGQVAFPVNAYSPGTFANAFTEVCVSTGPGPVTLSTYTLSGLPDGVYALFTYLPGFQISPPGPLSATVASGVGTRNITFDALTGRVNIAAGLPPGDAPAGVLYSLSREGPDSEQRAGSLSGAVGGPGLATEGKLGTGLYRLTLFDANPGRGLRREVPVSVTNGSTTTVTVDMAVPTFSISGGVSLQGNVILPSTWAVTVSSMAGLTAVGVSPEVQVFSYPLPERFDGNTRPLRQLSVTPFASTGTFSLSGLTPGGYLLRLREDLNPPTPPCAGCQTDPGLPEMASTDRVVFIGTTGVTGADLTLTNGARLSGTIRRPVGDASTDPRHLVLRLRRTDNLSVWKTDVNTSGAGTAAYGFPHLAAGLYILEVFEDTLPVKYAAPAQSVQISNADVTLNVDLETAATLIGRLRDADTQTLITAQNAGQFLPDNFEISAQANPWVPGGYAGAERNAAGGGYALDPNTGQFTITRLIPGTTYDVNFRGYANFGQEALGRGQRTYAPVSLGGVRLSAGQVVDLGTIDLNQGISLSGTIRNTAGVWLPNVRVTAFPALSNGSDRHNFQVEAFTDEKGRYEIHGVDRGQRYYDVIAAPRFHSGDVRGQLTGPKYGEERIRMVDVNTSTATTGLDFSLTPASGVLIGLVRTADGGALVPPFTEGQNQAGLRGANVTLHLDGAVLDENPLGEIEETTNADGTFRVDGLKPGSYTFRAISLGYTTALKKIVVGAAGTTNAGTFTLGRGATVSGAITKPDGDAPSASDLKMVVGVDANFEDFVFGRVESNPDTQLVTGYSLAGFEPGKDYSLIFVTAKDEIIEAASDVVFTSSTEARVLDLVFRPASPKVFVNQSRAGDTYTLRFFSSQPLRNLTAADNDLSQIVTSTSPGTISGVELSPSRDSLTVTYDATPLETGFTLRLTFHTTVTDPDNATGDTFLFDHAFDFHTGIGRRRSADIPNVTGGDCTLEGVAAGVSFDAGAFDVNRSSSVQVGIQSAVDLADLPPSPAPSLGAPRSRAARRARLAEDTVRRLGRAAFPSAGLFKAVSLAPTVNPFSAFYDIFLPPGVSHALKEEALLTLKYDDSVTDPAGVNVYYFDPDNNLFLLEKNQRTVDEVNKTVTVAVNHLSTFVVLQSQAPIVGTSDFTGTDIVVFNAPNPFNLKTKTVALTHASPPQDQVTEGTVIRYALPAGKSGEVKIDIFDMTGARVRTLTQTAPTGGTYYYTDWDGRNAHGDKVASGVYLGRLTVNGGDDKFFKMAVLK